MKAIKELNDASGEELKKRLYELRKGLSKDMAQVAVGTSQKNSKSVKRAKKTIARILTILNAKTNAKKQK